jgi:hypothetical protein
MDTDRFAVGVHWQERFLESSLTPDQTFFSVKLGSPRLKFAL